MTEQQRRFLLALRVVESSWPKSAGINALGDGGASLGPLQIQKSYWQDAREHSPDTVPAHYRDVGYWQPACATVEAYMRRYCPAAWEAGDWEIIARTHNGGPRGASKPATLDYWMKTMEAMKIVEETYGPIEQEISPIAGPNQNPAAVADNNRSNHAAGDAAAVGPRLQHPYARRPDTTSGRGLINTTRDGRGANPRRTDKTNTGGWTMSKFLSRKFLVTIGTMVTLLATSYGLPEEAVADVVQGAIALIGAVYVLGQAWVDGRQ